MAGAFLKLIEAPRLDFLNSWTAFTASYALHGLSAGLGPAEFGPDYCVARNAKQVPV